MPRGIYDRNKPAEKKQPKAWDFEMTVPSTAVDDLLRSAERDELADALIEALEDPGKVAILAIILQHRLNRTTAQLLGTAGELPPPQFTNSGESQP